MIPALIAGGATIAGGMMGADAASKGRRDAADAQRQALAQFLGIDAPEISDQELQLLIPQLIGEYTPEVEQSILQGDTALGDISIDDALRQNQMEALTGMEEIAEGGLTEADAAAMRGIQREVGQGQQARMESVLQQMAQRGTLGGGMELAAKISQQQEVNDQEAAAADKLAQEVMQRQMSGLQNLSSMSGNLRSQDYQEQEKLAQARDAIQKFNTVNQQNVQQRNVGQRNTAQQQNLAARQKAEQARVQTLNEQQQLNKGLIQQKYQNDMDLARARAGAYTGYGQQQQQAGQDKAKMIGGIASGIGDIATSFMGNKKG